MPNLTCVWRRLLWHNAVIFILTEAAVQLCRSLLVCIFKSVLIIISIFLFWSDVHLMLAVISQHVMLDQMMITEMYRRFWTQVNFEKRIFFLTRPKTHPSGGWGQNQKHFSWWMTCQDFMAWWQDGFSKNLSTPDSLKAWKKRERLFRSRWCVSHSAVSAVIVVRSNLFLRTLFPNRIWFENLRWTRGRIFGSLCLLPNTRIFVISVFRIHDFPKLPCCEMVKRMRSMKLRALSISCAASASLVLGTLFFLLHSAFPYSTCPRVPTRLRLCDIAIALLVWTSVDRGLIKVCLGTLETWNNKSFYLNYLCLKLCRMFTCFCCCRVSLTLFEVTPTGFKIKLVCCFWCYVLRYFNWCLFVWFHWRSETTQLWFVSIVL